MMRFSGDIQASDDGDTTLPRQSENKVVIIRNNSFNIRTTQVISLVTGAYSNTRLHLLGKPADHHCIVEKT